MKLGRAPRLAFGTSLELYTLSSPRLEFRPPGSRGRLNDLAHCSFVLTVALDCLPAMFASTRLGAFRRRGYHAHCRSEAASRPLRRILSIADGCVAGTAFVVRQRSWTRKSACTSAKRMQARDAPAHRAHRLRKDSSEKFPCKHRF